ncbi:polypeptide N-acetylgalactosaminyltransferase 35A-like isoform X1 [Euwallacea similis]|uniref:polypeptide N-acetylgalactosaminyltransferase 35A-like isoform X1 n=1 Tax=Euwallacea similis TaxID=1736056 RepID=UPI00344F9926
MGSINRSFLYGIGFASATWIISLYLYTHIAKNVSKPYKATSTTSISVHNIWQSNEDIKGKDKALSKSKDWKRQYNNLLENYGNNRKDLFEKLRPVLKTPLRNLSKLEEELFGLGLVQNPEEQEIKDEGYKIHAYNVLISNKLSLHREIPDTRHALCKNVTYEPNLPQASIIICFYNEHYRTLLRTLHSIMDKTPMNLLKEVVLVDDFSDIKNLHKDLEKYLKDNKLDKIKLIKTKQREGLIRARIFGAQHAYGDVLIFLDSHIEVNKHWIEPLVARIKDNSTNVVMPIIDIINPDTFAYSSSPLVRGGFNWGLHFKWEHLPKGTLEKPEDLIKPIKSPTMAGGLFAIDRVYFIKIGEYDAGMNIWGGENLEISFRLWMCGGSLEILPCSRVGHIFRPRRPYGSPDGQDTMLYNSLRVANVWMDDYKDYYLSHIKESKTMDFGDVSSRIQLRRELKCHDFDWYLKNVYPELTLPSDDEQRLKKKWSALEQDKFQPWHSRKRTYIDQFYIRLINSSLCIQCAKDVKTKGSSLILRPCLNSKKQLWYQTDKNELVLAQLLCLQAAKPHPILYKCHEMGADQEWRHKGGKNSPIYNLGAGTCLGVKKRKVNAAVEMRLCTDPELNTWDLINDN